MPTSIIHRSGRGNRRVWIANSKSGIVSHQRNTKIIRGTRSFTINETFARPPLPDAARRGRFHPKRNRKLIADHARNADIGGARTIKLRRVRSHFSGWKTNAAGDRAVVAVARGILRTVLERIP